MEEWDVFYENPLSVPKFTARDACLAAAMRYTDLNFWNREGLLKRLSPARKEGRWRKYNFSDIVILATAQQLINLGLPARSAIHWALEAHHELRRFEYAGLLIICIVGDEQHVRFTGDTTLAVTKLPENATVSVIVNIKHIAETARARLEAARVSAGDVKIDDERSEDAG